MSDNIPIDLQFEIIKKVSGVRSLVRFRSVSKPWKSFIDSSQFIQSYSARHTQPRSRILSYGIRNQDELGYICLVDDDIETFKVQQQELAPFVLSPLLKQYRVDSVVGTSHGLLCFYGFHNGYKKSMIVVWNPSIGKSFRINIAAPIGLSHTVYGFGVSPDTNDPTVVKIRQPHNKPWHVEVFTLTSGVWNVIPSANLPRQSIQLDSAHQVVIDRFIYFGAHEKTINDDGEYTTNPMVVSFDLITKEFNLVVLPDSLTNELLCGYVSLSKLKECLVVYGISKVEGVEGAHCRDVWVMEHDSSFRKLFSIDTLYLTMYKILGFGKNGECIFDIRKVGGRFTTLYVYDPSLRQIKNHVVCNGESGLSFLGSYKESLLLLDHSDSRIYNNNN